MWQSYCRPNYWSVCLTVKMLSCVRAVKIEATEMNVNHSSKHIVH